MTEVDHATRQHSELGASITERFWNCPGSVRLSRGAPNRETEASRRGTAAHEVAQMCLTRGQDAAEYVDRTVHGVVVDAGMADSVQVYLDDCRALQDVETWCEIRFDLAELNPPAPMFGTADFVAYSAATRTLYVHDYKNGYTPVAAEGNKQLRYYALGALLQIGKGKPVDTVHITICQPNSNGPALKRETFDVIDLMDWSVELVARAVDAMAPDAPTHAGAWCRFCPAAGTCETQARVRLADALQEFDAVIAGDAASPEMRLLSPAQRAAIFRASPLIRQFLDDVEAAIKAYPEGTGYKVVATDGRSAWRDPDGAAFALEMAHGIDPWAPREIVSPAQARSRLADLIRPEHKTKKAAAEAARDALARLIFTPKTGTAIVPEADPRPALPTNGAEFKDVEP